jgi:hypothetical protein
MHAVFSEAGLRDVAEEEAETGMVHDSPTH